jgi:hypothetical protein
LAQQAKPQEFALPEANYPTVQYYLSAIHFQRHHFNEAWTHLRLAEAILDKKGHHPRALADLRKTLQRQCPEKI